MKRIHSIYIRLISFFLIFAFILPSPILAATPDIAEPAASYYLDAYTAYICAVGSYDIQIWWNVIGTGTMADVGTLRILLYESTDNVNWTYVKTFLHTTYPHMLEHNVGHSINRVTYFGDSARYYKAYVTIYAGDGTNGDNRYVWTPVVQATP